MKTVWINKVRKREVKSGHKILSLVPAQEQSERTKAIANCDAADARKSFLIILNVLRLI